MAQSSLITAGYSRKILRAVKELVEALDTATGHSHNGTNSASLTATGNTLDGAYDQGGVGAGRAITVNDGAVTMTKNDAGIENVLELSASPSAGAAGAALAIICGANSTGAGITFANSGSGNDIAGTSSLWSVTAAGVATFPGASIGDITLTNDTAPAGTVCYIVRDNTGDTTINALTGKSVNLAVAGTDVVTVAGALVTIAQATTISLALTVSAGGAAITGNSTITGDLTVTGALTFGGNWTVGATLTVDELILDTDGVAPAGTNAYVVSDNTGDLTVNALTGKTFNVAVNGVDEYTFSATILDMLANALDNCGYIILNAATAPAATEVYAVNDNTGDLTLNALAGKTINFAVAGVDEVAFGATLFVFNDASNDRDLRVETNGMAYAIYSDGGKDALVLGSNTDTSVVDQLITISRAARTATAATNYYDLAIQPAGAVTVPAGVTAVVASLMVQEPNITATGTVTDAATLYISGEPTEGGTGNYGLMVAASIGLIADAKDFVIGAGRDVQIRWSTADADNHALAVGLGASLAIHLCQAADIATDWNVAAASNPTLYVHGATTPATEYVALSTDETDAHLNAVGANWAIEIGGTAELTITASAVNLAANTLQGGTASAGDLVLQSTSHATKGFVTIATTEPGLVVGGTGASVDRVTNDGTNAIHLFNGTAPVGAMTNGITLYSSGGEFYAMDAAGNATLNSPHSDDGDYIIYSYSVKKDQTVVIHLEKMMKVLAAKFPADFAQLMSDSQGLIHKSERMARGLARI